ncbi:MAG: diphosphomevalonate decarboxylase [Thermoanaerobaculia bacterium]|nr:diphosphomevalonate decarboxylase [Thermoanaerobaculia bacterium]
MKTATASAPSNIAFIKYWGAIDLDQVRPANASISMTLSECRSLTTVTFEPEVTSADEIALRDESGRPTTLSDAFRRGIERHLARIRERHQLVGRFSVITQNNFPAQAGLASSASGFAALAVAASSAANLEVDDIELSHLARISGSGSASRSVLGGFVEWPAGEDDASGYAKVLAPAEHWPLSDVIAIVETAGKEVSSRDGHRRAPSSPHFATRQALLPDRLDRVRAAIQERNLDDLGSVLELEAIELHLIAMSSQPAIFYWKPATLEVLAAVRRLRREGLSAWATMDAGANVHVICPSAQEAKVAEALAQVPGVLQVLRDRVGNGPQWHTDALP